MSHIPPFLHQRSQALSAGISIVRKVLQQNQFPNGFTSKQLFELAVKVQPPVGFEPFKQAPSLPTRPQDIKKGLAGPPGIVPVPRPEHPVRSLKFLKRLILPSLEGRQEIKTVCQPRGNAPPEAQVDGKKKKKVSSMEYVWKVVAPENRWTPPPSPKPRKVFGHEVGVGADFSHLNKRRRNARVGKVAAAVVRLKENKRKIKALKAGALANVIAGDAEVVTRASEGQTI